MFEIMKIAQDSSFPVIPIICNYILQTNKHTILLEKIRIDVAMQIVIYNTTVNKRSLIASSYKDVYVSGSTQITSKSRQSLTKGPWQK